MQVKVIVKPLIHLLLTAYLSLPAMEELLKQIQDYKTEIEIFTATDEKAAEEFRIKWRILAICAKAPVLLILMLH